MARSNYSEELKFWKGRRGKIVTEEFPRRAVLLKVALTTSMRLPQSDITALQERYADVEFV